jgi:hypothetical protein
MQREGINVLTREIQSDGCQRNSNDQYSSKSDIVYGVFMIQSFGKKVCVLGIANRVGWRGQSRELCWPCVYKPWVPCSTCSS